MVDLAELYDADAELRALLAVLAPRYAALLRAVHGLVMDALPGVGLERLPLPESAIRQATHRAFEQAVRIDATTREALQEQLRVALDRGYSAWEIGHGVPEEGFGGLARLFRETWKARPETVARTELATALNHASLDRYAATGVVDQVEIVEHRDTDAACAARNGQVVPLESRPGLLHPNCRVGLVPVVKPAAVDRSQPMAPEATPTAPAPAAPAVRPVAPAPVRPPPPSTAPPEPAVPFSSEAARRLAVLRPVEDAILRETRNRYEQAAALDGSGKALLKKSGGKSSVRFKPEELDAVVDRVEVFTHNHPGGSAFSLEDVNMADYLNVRELNAIAPDVRWRLRRLRQQWPGGDLERARLSNQVHREFQKRIADPRDPFTYADANDQHWPTVWSRYAAKYPRDVAFSREERA